MAVDPKNLDRLRIQQEGAIAETRERLQQLDGFKNDYQSLQDRLKTLPDKVTHDVMVPFGAMAFMPGKLVHTNEVLVLLGDNWFVERSAKQACDIIGRRIETLEKQINDMKQQEGLLQPRLDVTQEIKDMVEGQGEIIEIQEEYDEQKEAMWREEHRARVLAERSAKQSVEQKKQDHKSSTKPTLTDEDVWARLDALEIQEAERKELQRMEAEDSEPQTKKVIEGKQVRWYGDDQNGSDDEEDDDDEEEEEEEEEESMDSDDYEEDVERKESMVTTAPRRPQKITFCHSQPNPREPPDGPAGNEAADDSVQIKSPADIYRQFVATAPPRSILKSPKEDWTPKPKPELEKPHVIVPVGSKPSSKAPAAFTGAVVERQAPATSGAADAQPKKVSKFRARRMQQNT